MRQLLTLLSTLVLIVICAQSSLAQFRFSAEIRPRTEFRHGFKTPLEVGQTPAFFTEQRTRLITSYTSKKIEIGISIQDIRTWGSTDQIYKSDPALTNVNQAWAAYRINDFNKIVAGRQILDYDNARILGNLEWAQQGRSHDLLRYIFKKNSLTAHLGLAFNQDSETPEFAKLNNTYYSGVNNYKSLQFSWVKKTFKESSLSLLVLNQSVQAAPDSITYNQSMGLNASHRIGANTVKAEIHYQMGKNRNRQKINGFLAALSLDHTFDKVTTTLGIDWLSGDAPGSRKFEAFTPWYGTNHKFYGLMDYFYVGDSHQNAGLINPYIKANFALGKRVDFLVHIHHFSSDTKISLLNSGDVESNSLGNEVDLVFSCNMSPEVNLRIGYSQLFYSPSMEVVKRTTEPKNMASWAWAMMTFKPVLVE